ncbi:MAG TPA: hypothetical protein VL588_01465, partial [Bdellovibrionota bacterium]|nr:hypothetical protein [Bdellovibrionota bacterium]
NIADDKQFSRITGNLAGDIPADRRQMLADSLRAIATATASSGFRLSASKSYFDNFSSQFAAMNAIYGTGMGDSPEFLDLRKVYHDAATQAFNDLVAAYPAVVNAKLAEVGGLSAVTYQYSDIYGRIRDAAFAFALAEYLITRKMSRVVDIGPKVLNADAHAYNGQEFAFNVIKFSMFRTMLRRFSDTGATGVVPGTSSHSYIQHTTLAMTTEFDRTQVIYSGAPGQPFGTNHGWSSSAVLAGRGVRGGVFAGDYKTTPGAFGKYSMFPNQGLEEPLPVNLTTGQVDVNGKIVTTKSIFPTLMGIFGVKIPMEQMTEGIPFKPVMA